MFVHVVVKDGREFAIYPQILPRQSEWIEYQDKMFRVQRVLHRRSNQGAYTEIVVSSATLQIRELETL